MEWNFKTDLKLSKNNIHLIKIIIICKSSCRLFWRCHTQTHSLLYLIWWIFCLQNSLQKDFYSKIFFSCNYLILILWSWFCKFIPFTSYLVCSLASNVFFLNKLKYIIQWNFFNERTKKFQTFFFQVILELEKISSNSFATDSSCGAILGILLSNWLYRIFRN